MAGKGGSGANGAKVVIHTNYPEILALFEVDVSGGAVGEQGTNGVAGEGGNSGNFYSMYSSNLRIHSTTPLQEPGTLRTIVVPQISVVECMC